MEQIIRIGMDTSKSVFQLHGVNAKEQPVLRRKLSRREMVKFFEKLPRLKSRLRPVAPPITGGGCSRVWDTQ